MTITFAGWEGEVERGALSRRSYGPDLALVTLNHSLGYRKPDPGAREFALRMESFEGLKELGGEVHLKAGAVIAHKECALFSPNLDQYVLFLRAEFPSVLDEVIDRQADQAHVSERVEASFCPEASLLLGVCALEIFECLAAQFSHVERFAAHFCAGDT